MKSEKPRIALYFFRGAALFIGNAVDTEAHRHHLLEIFISLSSPLTMRTDHGPLTASAILIASDLSHRVESHDGLYAVLLVDGESQAARRLSKLFLVDRGARALPDSAASSFRDGLAVLFERGGDVDEAKALYDGIIRGLAGDETVPIDEPDPRIEGILKLFERSKHRKISIKEIANEIFLSESRLIHLFSSRIGISIRHYLLWLRLTDAVDLIASGKTFTDAAYDAGFSDSAHLSRTFRRMFGLKLLQVFKSYSNSRFVQAKAEKS